MLRGLQGWTRVDSQAQPFQGQARTIEGESFCGYLKSDSVLVSNHDTMNQII